MYGDPFQLEETMDSTRMSLQALCHDLNDTPVSFDDKETGDDKTLSAKFIMQLANEMSRGRANKDGTRQATFRDWKNVFLINGEKEVDLSIENAGATNRLLQVQGEAFTPEAATELHKWLKRGPHGVALGPWLEFVNGIRDELPRRMEEWDLVIRQRLQVPGADQRPSHLAIIALAAELFGECFGIGVLHDPKSILDDAITIWENVKKSATPFENSHAEQAYRAILEHVATNPNNWIYDEDRALGQFKKSGTIFGEVRPIGHAGVFAAVTRTGVKSILKQTGFSGSTQAAIMDQMFKEGLIHTPDPQRMVLANGYRARCYLFSAEPASSQSSSTTTPS
jgi:hypothetical protein